MSEATEGGLCLGAIQRLDKAAQDADIDDESLERLGTRKRCCRFRFQSEGTMVRCGSFAAIGYGTDQLPQAPKNARVERTGAGKQRPQSAKIGRPRPGFSATARVQQRSYC